MGIYDRDYYREDTRWSNPFARSRGTILLVLVLAFTFILQMAERVNGPDPRRQREDAVTATLQLDVKKTLDGEVWRLGSYAIVHRPGQIFQVLFTGLFLLWIGRHVEDLYGTREYLCFFVFTSILGGISYTAIGAFAFESPPLLGPSGAVTAILILFALHFPSWKILFLPVWVFVAAYAFLDILGLAGGTGHPAVVAVHLATASFAFLYHGYSLRIWNWLPGVRTQGVSRRSSQPRLRVRQPALEPQPAATATLAAPAPSRGVTPELLVDEHLEAKLDEVLEKVQKHGKESLTEGEREVLLKASEIYKKRRQSN